MPDAPRIGRPVPVLLMVRELGAGGTERQMTELARALDRGRFTPHVACFYARGFRADDLNASGIPVFELPLRSFLKPDLIRAGLILRAYLRDHSIRLVHTFDHPSNIFGIAAARFSGTPRVLGSQRGYRTVYQRRHRLFLRAGDLLADGIVVNCEAMRRHLSSDYSVPDRKIHLCYNGLDTNTFRPAPRARPDGLANASLVIGTVSVLRPEKGLPCLLDAFALVHEACPDARLVIVGSGPVARDLEARAAELGIGDACMFEPATRNVVPWLHAIDIFVQPSLSEALSNSLMEATGLRLLRGRFQSWRQPRVDPGRRNRFALRKGKRPRPGRSAPFAHPQSPTARTPGGAR